MSRTANVEPKTSTYFRIGGELVGFKTQLVMFQFAALSAIDNKTSYTKYDGYRVEEESITTLEENVDSDRIVKLLHAIAENGLKTNFRLNNNLVIQFGTRLKQMNYLANLLLDQSNYVKWRHFGAEPIGEPEIVEWDNMTQEHKFNFIAMYKK